MTRPEALSESSRVATGPDGAARPSVLGVCVGSRLNVALVLERGADR
jgi:hypothetical protein